MTNAVTAPRVSPAASRRPQDIVGWLIAGALVVSHFAILQRYAINFPIADDFSQILIVPHYFTYARTLTDKLGVVIALSPEHRLATLRLAALIQAHLPGGVNFLVLLYFGSLLLVLAAGLIVSTVDRDARGLFATVAAALLFSQANFENTLWASGALTHFQVLGYAFAALYCLGRTGVGWQIGAGLLALAAVGTSAPGLMLFPSAVILLCLMRRWRSALLWAICGAALFSVYFIGYQPPQYQLGLGTYLRNPWMPLHFFLIAVGSFGILPSIAFAIGVAVCAFWGWALASGRIRSVPPVIVAMITFLLLTEAAITWGRTGFGDAGALVSRYRVYSQLVTAVTLAALLSVLPRILAMRVLAVAVPVSLISLAVNWWYNFPEMEGFANDHRYERDYYLAEGRSPPNTIPPPAFRDFTLSAAKIEEYFDPANAALKNSATAK